MFVQHGKTTIICEVAQTYEGSFDIARRLVQAAVNAKADAVKFQIFKADELATKDYKHYKLFKSLELPPEQWGQLIQQAHDGGINMVADVFGIESAEMLLARGIDGFKIHATDIKNTPLLEFLARSGKPLLLSVGGSQKEEIEKAVAILKKHNAAEIVLLHGFQSYPTLVSDTNLNKLKILRRTFGLSVGFADHIDGDHRLRYDLSAMAMGMGASVLEKHITLERALKMEDYESALNPSDFKEFVERIRELDATFGEKTFSLQEPEAVYRKTIQKHIVAARDLPAKTQISETDIVMKRTAEDYPFQERGDIIGAVLAKDFKKDEVIRTENILRAGGRGKKVVCALACRVQSTRLYGKPLQLLDTENAVSILDYMLDHLAATPQINETVLAISEGEENTPFIDVAKKRGLSYVVGDQKDVLGRLISAGKEARADIIFRVTSESPFMHMDGLEEALKKHAENGASLTVFEGLPEGAYFELINLGDLKKAHKNGEDRHRSELCTLYINEHPEKFKIQTLPAPKNLKRPDIRITIDWPEDLIVARELYKALKKPGQFIKINEIIHHMDAHPELHRLNSWIDAGTGRIWK